MKPEKEKWINGVIEGSKEIKRAEASPFLFTRIKEKIKGDTVPSRAVVPVKQALALAVAVLILIIFNLDLMFNSSSASSSKQEIYRVAVSYNLLPENNIYLSK
jgi:hypothetical protein